MVRNLATRRRELSRFAALILTLLILGCGGDEAEPDASSSPHASATPETHASPEGGGHGSGDPWSEAIDKATLHAGKGELKEASEYSSVALKIAREKDEPRKLITSLHNSGKLALSQGDTHQGIELFGEALELERHLEKPDPRMIALSLNKIAAAHYAEEDREGALHALHEALKVEGINQELEAELLHNLASIYQQGGNKTKAAQCLEKARRLRASASTELPSSGPAGLWFHRKMSTHSYKKVVQIFQERSLAPSRIAAFSRFNSRKWSAPESETSDDKSSH